jgi:dolichol-phosphate mannosyltransferase
MRTIIILPTYNERETLPILIRKIKEVDEHDFDILVIDDNSPDGTREIAQELAQREGNIHMIERPAKLGLGTAYVAGFKWGLERGYDCFIEMDSDLSHNPYGLPGFVREIEKGSDLAIGSRYLRGTISVVGWDFKRLLMSKFGNFYASRLLRLPLTDLTSGYRAYSRRAMEGIPLDDIHSEGYAFQIEMAYHVWQRGLKVKEIPITFTERYKGRSKMSRAIIREAVWLPWRLRSRGAFNLLKRLLFLRGPGAEAKNRRL